MGVDVAREVVALKRLTAARLRDRYAEVFGEATTTGNTTWLIRRIAWRLQALAEGDLSDRVQARANWPATPTCGWCRRTDRVGSVSYPSTGQDDVFSEIPEVTPKGVEHMQKLTTRGEMLWAWGAVTPKAVDHKRFMPTSTMLMWAWTAVTPKNVEHAALEVALAGKWVVILGKHPSPETEDGRFDTAAGPSADNTHPPHSRPRGRRPCRVRGPEPEGPRSGSVGRCPRRGFGRRTRPRPVPVPSGEPAPDG